MVALLLGGLRITISSQKILLNIGTESQLNVVSLQLKTLGLKEQFESLNLSALEVVVVLEVDGLVVIPISWKGQLERGIVHAHINGCNLHLLLLAHLLGQHFEVVDHLVAMWALNVVSNNQDGFGPYPKSELTWRFFRRGF